MKKLLYTTYLIALSLLLTLTFGCKPDNPEDTTGNIYGIVTAKGTAEPIRAARVELTILSDETGTHVFELVSQTITYNDGHFEFKNLPVKIPNFYGTEVPALYAITVEASGYNRIWQTLKVFAGQTSRIDIQLEEVGKTN